MLFSYSSTFLLHPSVLLHYLLLVSPVSEFMIFSSSSSFILHLRVLLHYLLLVSPVSEFMLSSSSSSLVLHLRVPSSLPYSEQELLSFPYLCCSHLLCCPFPCSSSTAPSSFVDSTAGSKTFALLSRSFRSMSLLLVHQPYYCVHNYFAMCISACNTPRPYGPLDYAFRLCILQSPTQGVNSQITAADSLYCVCIRMRRTTGSLMFLGLLM